MNAYVVATADVSWAANSFRKAVVRSGLEAIAQNRAGARWDKIAGYIFRLVRER